MSSTLNDAGDWPLVGRDRELAVARAALRERRGLVLVGEAGSGKTRLASEVVSTTAATGVRWHVVIGSKGAARVPLGAWSHLLPDTWQPGGDDLATWRVLAGSLDASDGAIHLFVDDAQWLDPVSAGLVHHLVTTAEQGRLDEGLRLLQQSAVLHELDNRRGYQSWTFAITSRVHAQRGEVAEAETSLAQARRTLWPSGQVFASDLDVAALWIEVLSGRLADAEALLDDAVARSDDEGALMVSAYLRHEAIRAASWFAHAAALAAESGEGLVGAGHQFVAFGMHLLAAEAFARGAVALRRAGSLALAAQAKKLSRQQRAWCRGARTPALKLDDLVVGLTTREFDVATQAAVGKANLEIADDLGISVRTVETHLQRAFAKLGVNRRADLSSLLQPD